MVCLHHTIADYRGKQFAAKNGVLQPGDTSYPGSDVLLASDGTRTVNRTLCCTRRSSPQLQQPVYLAKVLGMSTVTIGAQAIAQVDVTKPPCILALKDSISFQGSPTVSSPTCGIASNSTATDAIDFTGNNGIDLNAPSFTVGGCSQTGETSAIR